PPAPMMPVVVLVVSVIELEVDMIPPAPEEGRPRPRSLVVPSPHEPSAIVAVNPIHCALVRARLRWTFMDSTPKGSFGPFRPTALSGRTRENCGPPPWLRRAGRSRRAPRSRATRLLGPGSLAETAFGRRAGARARAV